MLHGRHVGSVLDFKPVDVSGDKQGGYACHHSFATTLPLCVEPELAGLASLLKDVHETGATEPTVVLQRGACTLHLS